MKKQVQQSWERKKEGVEESVWGWCVWSAEESEWTLEWRGGGGCGCWWVSQEQCVGWLGCLKDENEKKGWVWCAERQWVSGGWFDEKRKRRQVMEQVWVESKGTKHRC